MSGFPFQKQKLFHFACDTMMFYLNINDQNNNIIDAIFDIYWKNRINGIMFPTTESSGWLPNVDKCFRFSEISTFGLQDKINSKIIYIFSNISNLSGNNYWDKKHIFFYEAPGFLSCCTNKIKKSSCAHKISKETLTIDIYSN